MSRREGKEQFLSCEATFVFILSDSSLWVLALCRTQLFPQTFLLPAPWCHLPNSGIFWQASAFAWHILCDLPLCHLRWGSRESHRVSVGTQNISHNTGPHNAWENLHLTLRHVIALTGMSVWQTLVSQHTFSSDWWRLVPQGLWPLGARGKLGPLRKTKAPWCHYRSPQALSTAAAVIQAEPPLPDLGARSHWVPGAAAVWAFCGGVSTEEAVRYKLRSAGHTAVPEQGGCWQARRLSGTLPRLCVHSLPLLSRVIISVST